MYRLLKDHSVSVTIILFIFTLYGIHTLSPSFIYKKNGEIRQFGIGYKNKTILPIWLIAIILAILMYVAVHYWLFL